LEEVDEVRELVSPVLFRAASWINLPTVPEGLFEQAFLGCGLKRVRHCTDSIWNDGFLAWLGGARAGGRSGGLSYLLAEVPAERRRLRVEHVFDSVQRGGGRVGGAIVVAIIGLIKAQMSKSN
jgi:hypothetical protein